MGMARFIVKRILMCIPVLLGVTFLVFAIMDLTPGDPAMIILGADAGPADLERVRTQLGLDRPFLVRYVSYVADLVRGNWGVSYRNNLDVGAQIANSIGNTLILCGTSVVLSVVIGVPIGILSALKQYTPTDNIITVLALFCSSCPTFWLALVFVIIFSLHLGWFPASGMGEGLSGMLVSLVLPAVTLSSNTMAIIVRTTRSSMLDVIRQDYVDTARAKGITEGRVIRRHMLNNALIPIVTIIGLNFGGLLGGSVLTESIFSWPGVGRFVVDSIRAKDTPCVLAASVTLAISFTIVNLLVDLLYGFLDPRIKTQYKKARRSAV